MAINRRGIAFLMALGMVAISAVMIAALSMLISSYVSTTRSSKQKEYSLHYANMALDEIKWHIQKGYKRWLYEATHDPVDEYYDYETAAHSTNDVMLTGSVNPDSSTEGGYVYTAVPVDDVGNTWWIKVVDHLIWPDGEIREDYYAVASSGMRPSGRIEGWLRISDKDDSVSQYTYVYDIFCKGTDLRGVKLRMEGANYIIEDDYPPKVTYIRAVARGTDSLSVSEFAIGAFKGHINVGKGYNVFGKLHAYDYIDFIFTAQQTEESLAKIYDQFSVSDQGEGFKIQGSPLGGGGIATQKAFLEAHQDDTMKLQDDNFYIKTWGFHANNAKKAWASFKGNGNPAIIPPINPNTDEHFSRVRREAKNNGVLVENGDVKLLKLDPGALNVNGDGKLVITLDSGTLFVNGSQAGSGSGTYTVNIADLESPLMYVDGNPSTKGYYNGTVASESHTNLNYGIYKTKGIRGLTGVLDGQLSIFSDYDAVIAGDIIYQEFCGKVTYTYKDFSDMRVKQGYPGAGAEPDQGKPNILGVFVKHDIVIPGNMFNFTNKKQANYYDIYNKNNIADRVDGEGTGVLSGAIGGDSYPDIFTMGVFYAKHRVYGETRSSTEHAYARTTNYVYKKGTWFLYGSATCDEQIYAVTTDSGQQTQWNGFKFRSYNYDPNLYTYEPPFTLKIEVQPIWSWRVVTTYPEGIQEY